MSRETSSALTPEEWRMRTIACDVQAGVTATATEMGILIHTDEEDIGPWDPRKMLALANLALLLDEAETGEGLSGAVTLADADVCESAAWYFRKLARELIDKAKDVKDPEERRQWLDHARQLTDANERIHRLAETLRGLVPPQ